MSFNKAKVLKSAEKYVQQGKIVAAIDEYRKIVDADPNDLTMINTLGDLCVRAGRTEEAIQNFSRIAENYRENGFTLKAIAMYKKISKLEPSNFETSLKLADLYAKQGLIVDARQQYLIVADAYKRNGQAKRALEVLQKIADLDPENTAVRLKLAENYHLEGLNDQAHDAYLYAGQEFAKKGKLPDAISALTKAISINPSGKASLKSLADVYIQQNDIHSAVNMLSAALERNPNDVDILVILGRTYISAKLLEEAEATFSHLLELDKSRYDYLIQVGRAYLEVGKFDRTIGAIDRCMDLLIARRQEEKGVTLLKNILEYDANNMLALKRLTDIYTRIREDHNLASTLNLIVDVALRKGQKDEAIKSLRQLVEIEPDEPSYKQRLASLGAAVEPSKPAYSIPTSFEPAIAATTPLSANKQPQTDSQIIERQLREAEMFASRGYADSAAQILEDLINQYPNHIESRLKIKQLYIDGGLEEKAANQCLELAKLYEAKGDRALASDLVSEAYDLNPALNKTAKNNGQNFAKTASDGIEIDLNASLDGDFNFEQPSFAQPKSDPFNVAAKPQSTTYQPQASTPSGFDLFSKPATPSSNATSNSSLSYGLPDLFNQQPGPSASTPAPTTPMGGFDFFNQTPQSSPQGGMPDLFNQAAASQFPSKSSAQPPSSIADIFSVSSQSSSSVAAVPLGSKGETPALPNANFEINIEDTNTGKIAKDKILKDELEGVDFYIAQGYMEIARSTLEDLEKQHPNHPEILRRFAQMGINRQTPASAPVANLLKTSSDLEVIEELPNSAILESKPKEGAGFELFGGISNTSSQPPAIQRTAPPPPTPAPIPDALSARAQTAMPPQGGSLFDDLISNVEAELDDMPTSDMMPIAAANSKSAVDKSTSSTSSSAISDQSDLGSIFKDFVNEFETADKPDYETHYNLGLAYKDMELFDDAIEQFQLAFKATSPTSGDGNYFNCCNMLGYCFLRNNMARPSAVWYKRGLEAPARSEEEYQAMRFDLAEAYEHLGENDKSLEYLQEVYALDINYRDVGTKIRELQEKMREEQ